MAAAKKEKQEELSIDILITAKCDTVTGNSTLTYHFGMNPSGELHARVFSNTNGGMFSKEWIAWNDILDVLEKQGTEVSFSSILFVDLYEGQSVNTPAFLIAALINEKVLRYEEGKIRKYVYNSPAALLAKIDKASTGKVTKKTARKPSK
jgi:hypothetical protein